MNVSDLSGQRALVTDATWDIGKACAVRLASLGADVVVHGGDATQGRDTVEEIEAAGGAAQWLDADLGDPEAVAGLARAAGDIDILINNAYISTWAPTADLDVAAFDAMIAVNARAPYLLVAGLAPGMVGRRRGSIVNVSSVSAEVGLIGGAAYSASKAALPAMTRSWAAEFGPSGVRVNAVSPGATLKDHLQKPVTNDMATRTPVGRAAAADEIAAVAVFLASPDASFINGANVVVDGGYTAV